MSTKLHAICDSQGRPIDLFVTAGPKRRSLANVDRLRRDCGYDADWFREALQDRGIRACIPRRRQRKAPVGYDKRRYKRRNRTASLCSSKVRIRLC